MCVVVVEEVGLLSPVEAKGRGSQDRSCADLRIWTQRESGRGLEQRMKVS